MFLFIVIIVIIIIVIIIIIVFYYSCIPSYLFINWLMLLPGFLLTLFFHSLFPPFHFGSFILFYYLLYSLAAQVPSSGFRQRRKSSWRQPFHKFSSVRLYYISRTVSHIPARTGSSQSFARSLQPFYISFNFISCFWCISLPYMLERAVAWSSSA